MPVHHCFRLTHGTDIFQCVQQYAKDHRIQAGVPIACVGSLKRWRVRGADGRALFDGSDRVEIVSLIGTISEHGCHLHIGLARENLDVIGGHLVEGCIVNTTAEVVIMEIEDIVFKRAFDEDTGYHELVIVRNG